jgi:DNA invertase Pin-like site-specific DNA recombinase
MRKYQPSQVDWPAIRARIEAGEGYTSVAKDFEVTRQAIQKRCNREEWLKGKDRTIAVRRELHKRNQMLANATAQPDGQPQLVAGAQPSQPVMLRDDKRTAIVEMLGEGVPKVHAAAIAGVSEATLHRWVNEDEKFKSEVRAAESAAVALRVRRIGKAGEKDWRADSWYLERTQRAEFGSDSQKGGGVAVQINIDAWRRYRGD